jgi:hypothetical protein
MEFNMVFGPKGLTAENISRVRQGWDGDDRSVQNLDE